MDFDEEEEEEVYNRTQVVDDTNGIKHNNDDNHGIINKSQPHSTSVNNKTKTSTKLSVQDNNQPNEQQPGVEQQDEWEEFEGANSKYEQLRLKFSRGTNDQNNGGEDDDNDEYYDDANNHNANNDDNTNNIGGDEEQLLRNNRRREQLKDKPVWKIDQAKQTESIPVNDSVDSSTKKVEEPSTTKSDVYRPPHSRGSSSVTIVSGVQQRPSKKEKPNLASTEEFPTLGTANVNKK
jgi:hypothetical protein